MSCSQSLSCERGLASTDTTSIYHDGSGNLWVSFEPWCVLHGGREFLKLEANSGEFSSLITCLVVRNFKMTYLYFPSFNASHIFLELESFINSLLCFLLRTCWFARKYRFPTIQQGRGTLRFITTYSSESELSFLPFNSSRGYNKET